MTKNFLIASILLIIVVANCAVQKPVMKEEKIVTIEVPSGVDTLTTIIADSIFSLVAVEEGDENRARELFDEAQWIDQLADSLWFASQNGLRDREDTLITLRQLSSAEKYLQLNRESYRQIQKMMKKTGRLNTEVLFNVSKELMLQAVVFFENSIKTNRFEIIYRQRLSQVLQKLAQRLHDNSYLTRAAEELERIVFVVKEYHQLYYELGDIYFKLGDWNNAFHNFELAKSVLRNTAIFSIQNPEAYFNRINEVPLDTSRLVNYLNKQAVCKTKLYEAQPALAFYREAKDITPDDEFKKLFEDRIQWILWDDGNIRASEIKGKADSLRVVDKNYLTAKNVYLELLPILWTKRTRDEINWRIAQLDYSFLENYADGVERMFIVIRNTAIDSLTGSPLDSTSERYFNTYGQMCFDLGTKNYKKDRLIAYIYFNQAAETNYNDRGRAYLQLAGISKFDPNETIHLCERSMDYIDDLDDNEKRMLYDLLYRSYKKLGDFETATHWFEHWKIAK